MTSGEMEAVESKVQKQSFKMKVKEREKGRVGEVWEAKKNIWVVEEQLKKVGRQVLTTNHKKRASVDH